ncbi:MAG TPA: hypothetical protein VH251_06945, partial [Verrucomicrobiae bacterium]|nr:hypothetical protein [Verrucomicrobiae bacterium]
HLTHVQHASFEERNPVGDRNKLAASHTEEFHKGAGGPGEQGHGQPNVGTERTVRTATETSTFHDNNTGHGQNFTEHTAVQSSVSKVYRPPVTATHSTPSGGGGNGNGHGTQQGGNPRH